MSEDLDLLILGQRVRHARRRKGATLADLSELVGRPVPYLSQLENGKVEPKLSLVGDLAVALDTTTANLLEVSAPDRRSELEITIERAQADSRYAALGLPHLKPSAKVADNVLEHIVGLWEVMKKRGNRLGGFTGQYMLRRIGKDTPVTSQHVVAALVREGVVDKAVSAKRDQAKMQAAFNAWAAESGRPLAHISRILAMTVD